MFAWDKWLGPGMRVVESCFFVVVLVFDEVLVLLTLPSSLALLPGLNLAEAAAFLEPACKRSFQRLRAFCSFGA